MATTTDYGIEAPGYRLPAGTHVGIVRLQIADLERSIAYYDRVLGLEAVDRSAEHAVLGATDGSPLIELRERPDAAPVTPRSRLGLFHYAIRLPDRAALGSFIEHLSRIGERVGASDHLVSEALYLSDPDGLGIEVYADRPRDEWRHESRQLVMTTEPLDIAALAHAADHDWDGMPAGTTMGHVHLHVGDLEAATAFYHEALGLDKVVWSYPGALFLSAGGYHHHLGVNTWARGAAPADESDAKLLEWELRVPSQEDLDAVAKSLERAGYGAQRNVKDILTRDPSGTALRVRADPIVHSAEPSAP